MREGKALTGRKVTLTMLQPFLASADAFTQQHFANRHAILLRYPQSGAVTFAAAVWENSFHANALYFDVVGDVAWLQQLLEDLRQLADHHDRLQYSSYAAQSAVITQLQAKHFRAFRRTAMSDYRKVVATPEADVRSRSQLTSAQWHDVVQMSFANYVAAHADNPVTFNHATFEQQLAEAEDTQPSFLVENQQVQAYVFWFEDEPGALTSAWLGGQQFADIRRLLQTALFQVQARYSVVNGEFDDTDIHAWTVYQQLALPDPKPLISWQLLLDATRMP